MSRRRGLSTPARNEPGAILPQLDAVGFELQPGMLRAILPPTVSETWVINSCKELVPERYYHNICRGGFKLQPVTLGAILPPAVSGNVNASKELVLARCCTLWMADTTIKELTSG